MKIANWLNPLLVLITVFVFNNVSDAQVLVERSKEKVIISGIPYYIHHVKKGETAYSISKAYGITVEELIRENPPALYGVNEGQALRIPFNLVDTAKQAESVPPLNLPHDNAKYIYHILKPGETIYSLSKSYGVSENEIIQGNPGIDINKLSVGSEIAIPRREFMTERQKFDSQQQKYIYHKVLKGESLSSIAQQYGLTVRVLRRENRDLRFPQVGDFVRIPVANTVEIPETEPVQADTVPAVVEEPARIARPPGYTTVKDLTGSLNVAVLLPFYLKENSVRFDIDSSRIVNGRKIYKPVKKPEDWIYRESIDFIEMYEGILIAADTLRSLGLSINLNIYDIKSDTVEVTRLIMSGKLSSMDLIIGPVYSHNLNIVAEYARGLGIPVVSPVPLINNSALLNNPTLFMASSSLEIAQIALAKKVSEYYDNNFVFIHTDTAGTDPDVNRFKNLIFRDLSYKLPYEEIKFKEFPFYTRSMFGNDSINRLSHALSDHSDNVVIIASEEAPVISEVIDQLYGLSRKFNVKVFAYPVIRDMERLDQKELFDMNMVVYSPYWIDYTKSDVMHFNKEFRHKFLTEPVEKSFAWQGYDITYYFLSGLAMFGKEFLQHPEIHFPDLLQTEYDFVRKGAGDGFENQTLFLIRYTKDYEVKLVRDDTFPQQ